MAEEAQQKEKESEDEENLLQMIQNKFILNHNLSLSEMPLMEKHYLNKFWQSDSDLLVVTYKEYDMNSEHIMN